MSNNKKAPKKLQINRETLRTLNSETLSAVQGGSVGPSALCTNGNPTATGHCNTLGCHIGNPV